MLPDCLGTLSSTLCQIAALKEAIGYYVCDNTIFLKWGIVNVPFCSIFVPFHFYLIMTLDVPCLDNIFMVLLISALGNIKIGAAKPILLDSGSLGGERGFMRVWAWFVIIVYIYIYIYIVHILNSSKNSIFFVANSDLCRAMLPNYLRTYSSALC